MRLKCFRKHKLKDPKGKEEEEEEEEEGVENLDKRKSKEKYRQMINSEVILQDLHLVKGGR